MSVQKGSTAVATSKIVPMALFIVWCVLDTVAAGTALHHREPFPSSTAS